MSRRPPYDIRKIPSARPQNVIAGRVTRRHSRFKTLRNGGFRPLGIPPQPRRQCRRHPQRGQPVNCSIFAFRPGGVLRRRCAAGADAASEKVLEHVHGSVLPSGMQRGQPVNCSISAQRGQPVNCSIFAFRPGGVLRRRRAAGAGAASEKVWKHVHRSVLPDGVGPFIVMSGNGGGVGCAHSVLALKMVWA